MMRILIAEDKKINRRILVNMVREMGYQAVEAEDGEQALRALQQDASLQLAVLDWEMPALDGPALCRKLRAQEQDGLDYHYILLATGHDRKEDIASGFAAGADDYIVKPYDIHEMRVRLKVGERIVSLQQRLRNLAMYDELTGLFNRRTIMAKLADALKDRVRLPLGAAILDIDHFKAINDQYGHPVGDIVLVETAKCMAEALPEGIIGRMGGEEFIILFHPASRQDAFDCCEKLRKAIAGQTVAAASGLQAIQVTASIGFSLATEPVAMEALLLSADQAMYRAKEQGRNRVAAD